MNRPDLHPLVPGRDYWVGYVSRDDHGHADGTTYARCTVRHLFHDAVSLARDGGLVVVDEYDLISVAPGGRPQPADKGDVRRLRGLDEPDTLEAKGVAA